MHEGDGSDGGDSRQPAGEVPAWESCGKVIRQERQEYQEFVVSLAFGGHLLGAMWDVGSVNDRLDGEGSRMRGPGNGWMSSWLDGRRIA